MTILLLHDRASEERAARLRDALVAARCAVHTEALRYEALQPCVGCFGCWVRTPGRCVIASDGANDIASAQMRADAVVLLTRIAFGGFDADVKAFVDRSIQNILPFFDMVEGEMHHAMRYERYPAWIAVGYGAASDAERDIFEALAGRNARNMRTRRHLGMAIEGDDDGLRRAASRIRELLEVSA